MMQNPLDLTQTDLRGLMEAGQTLANIPGVGGGIVTPGRYRGAARHSRAVL